MKVVDLLPPMTAAATTREGTTKRAPRLFPARVRFSRDSLHAARHASHVTHHCAKRFYAPAFSCFLHSALNLAYCSLFRIVFASCMYLASLSGVQPAF